MAHETNNMDEAFNALANVPADAPGVFTAAVMLEAITDGLKQGYASSSDPDYDVAPFIAFGGPGGMTVWPVASYMGSEGAKDVLMMAARGITAKYPFIHTVALISGGWMAKVKSQDELEGKSVSEYKHKREIVFVSMESRDGSEHNFHCFDVLRLDTGNHLVASESDSHKEFTGRMANFFNRKE